MRERWGAARGWEANPHDGLHAYLGEQLRELEAVRPRAGQEMGRWSETWRVEMNGEAQGEIAEQSLAMRGRQQALVVSREGIEPARLRQLSQEGPFLATGAQEACEVLLIGEGEAVALLCAAGGQVAGNHRESMACGGALTILRRVNPQERADMDCHLHCGFRGPRRLKGVFCHGCDLPCDVVLRRSDQR